MNYHINLYTGIFFLFLLNCSLEKGKKEVIIQKNIFKTLESWNLKADISVKKVKNTLSISIFYKENDNKEKASYYYDVYTNELIVKTFIYKHKDILNNYDSIKITLEFEKAPDIARFYLDKKKIAEIDHFFQNNLFYQNVLYSLEKFNYNTLTYFKSIIKYINNGLVQFNYNFNKNNYWELLNSYSNFCTNPTEENLKKTEMFIIFISAVKKEHSKDFNFDVNKNLFNFLKNCSMNEKVYDLNFKKLELYLKNRTDKKRFK